MAEVIVVAVDAVFLGVVVDVIVVVVAAEDEAIEDKIEIIIIVFVVVGDVDVDVVMLLLRDMVLFEATFVTEAAFEAGCFWFGVFFIDAAALVVVIIIVVWYSFCYCAGRLGRGSSIIQYLHF